MNKEFIQALKKAVIDELEPQSADWVVDDVMKAIDDFAASWKPVSATGVRS